MTTTLERSAAVAAGLRKGRIASKEFVKGPLGKDIMALRIGPLDAKNVRKQGIRLWTGVAEMDITDVDKTHRQAVIAVEESQRDVTRTYEISYRPISNGRTSLDRQLRDAARRAFPATLPDRAQFRVDKHEVLSTSSYGRQVSKVTGTMTLKPTSMTLLLGIDETSHFICALPERVVTVDEAHDVLRPPEVPEGSYRQGEWFFVPATEAEVEKLYRHVADSAATPRTRRGWGTSSGPRFTAYAMERGSSHHGMVVTVPEVGKFTIGIIKDRRAGHHNELLLPTWHKVIRNTEVIFSEPKTLAERRQRTWD